METHRVFFLDWFGLHGRELGSPERFYTDNPEDLISLVQRCALQSRPCFCSVQPYRSRDIPFGLEKLFFDFDSKMELPDLQKAWKDLLSLVEHLKDELNIEPFIVRTYRGFHVYTFLWRTIEFNPSQQATAKEVYATLQKLLLGNRSYETLDRQVVGDLKRLSRVPYSLHEKGVECVPVDLDRQPLQIQSLNFYREHGIREDLFREVVQEVRDRKTVKEVLEVFNSFKPKPTVKGPHKKWITRPCFTEALKTGEMPHAIRMALVYEAFCSGLNREQITDLFRGINDFDEDKTRYQVNWLLDHAKVPVKPYRCRTIQRKGWCLESRCPMFKG